MRYMETVRLRNGAECLLRNGLPGDAEALHDIFARTHAQTEFLLSYPDESSHTVQSLREFLARMEDDQAAMELCAYLDGVLVGSASIEQIGRKDKVKHRASFGVTVDKPFCGMGVGRALTNACVSCARRAGFAQIELTVVAENARAIALYKSVGFAEFGRNPKGFKTREGVYQPLLSMRLDLEEG